MRLSETPVVENRPPPLLGEHTQEILQEKLGLTELQIKSLKDQGII
jgi:crotonobetainyl-CoA:carnitine CoA-transferase CaiB-like acyl-CoA transferase